MNSQESIYESSISKVQLTKSIENLARKGVRVDDRDVEKRKHTFTFTYTDSESGLVIKDETVAHLDAQGQMGAMGRHTAVESNSELVFEREGMKVMLNKPRAWTKRIEVLASQ